MRFDGTREVAAPVKRAFLKRGSGKQMLRQAPRQKEQAAPKPAEAEEEEKPRGRTGLGQIGFPSRILGENTSRVL